MKILHQNKGFIKMLRHSDVYFHSQLMSCYRKYGQYIE